MKKKKTVKKQIIKKFENKLTKYLDESKIKYSIIEHRVVFTAHDTAQTTKKKLGEIAKVVLVKADKGLALAVLPAGKYLDFKGIQKVLKAKKVSLANEKDITKQLKTKVGLLHPFGNLFKLPTLLDKNLSKAKKMIASAQSYTESLEISVKDFIKLTEPKIGTLSKTKK